MSERPRRLYIAIALQASFIVASALGALGVALAGIAVAASLGILGLVLAPILLTLAAGLGLLSFLSVGGLVGTLHGERRGFWLALVAHALLALVLAAAGIADLASTPTPGAPDTRAWLPAFVGAGILAASAAILLTPSARAWYGVV